MPKRYVELVRFSKRVPLRFACLVMLAASSAAADKITWKPVPQAVLKADNQPLKIWNVYQAAKNRNLVLVQLWRRYVLLDIKAHQAFDIDPATLEHKGNELRGSGPSKTDRLLQTAEWDLRDVGPAEMVRFKLEGRLLEVQLPHPLDVRLPVHY